LSGKDCCDQHEDFMHAVSQNVKDGFLWVFLTCSSLAVKKSLFCTDTRLTKSFLDSNTEYMSNAAQGVLQSA